MTAGDIFKEAMENLGVIAVGDELDSQHIDSLIRTFNVRLQALTAYGLPDITVSGVEDIITAPSDCMEALTVDLTAKMAPKFASEQVAYWEAKAQAAKASIHGYDGDGGISFAPDFDNGGFR